MRQHAVNNLSLATPIIFPKLSSQSPLLHGNGNVYCALANSDGNNPLLFCNGNSAFNPLIPPFPVSAPFQLLAPVGFPLANSPTPIPLRFPAPLFLGGYFPAVGPTLPNYSAGCSPFVLPSVPLPKAPSQKTKVPRKSAGLNIQQEQRRKERETQARFYVRCMLNFLERQPGNRCSLDEFVDAYSELPEVKQLKETELDASIPPITKKNRGDLVRMLRRNKIFNVTSFTAPQEDSASATKGCIVELDQSFAKSPSMAPMELCALPSDESTSSSTSSASSASSASSVGELCCEGFPEEIILSASNTPTPVVAQFGKADLSERPLSLMIKMIKEHQLKAIVVELLESPAHNQYRGSVSIEKIQNIVMGKFVELYTEVVGKKHNSWKDFLERHLDVFQINSAKDGKLRMRLKHHTEWELGDLREQHDRETREQHIVDCLKGFLQSCENQQCTVNEFIESYPSLPQNQIIQAMAGGEDGAPSFPVLTKRNRGDLVRLIQRHPTELRYSRDCPSNTIFLVCEDSEQRHDPEQVQANTGNAVEALKDTTNSPFNHACKLAKEIDWSTIREPYTLVN